MAYFFDYKTTSNFGYRTPPTEGATSNHKGVDTAFPSGTPVQSLVGGEVIKTGYQKSAGNFVNILGDDGYTHKYFHLSSIGVNTGDTIKAGDSIGLSGSTGTVSGPHLHYEIHVNGSAVNPFSIYNKDNVDVNNLTKLTENNNNSSNETITLNNSSDDTKWYTKLLGYIIYFIIIIGVAVLGGYLFIKAFD